MKFNVQPIAVQRCTQNQEPQERQVSKVEKELTTTINLVPTRKGIHDKKVEVYVNGELKETYLSQVQVGQPWHTVEGNFSNKWFVCLSPVKLDYSRDSKNPTIILGAMNVLQADSLETRMHKPARLLSSTPSTTVTPKLHRPAKTILDVEDVEVTNS